MMVSVLAANYNNAPWVIDSLESIHWQTFKDFELIIVDDCSTDNSPERIKGWLAEKGCSNYRFIQNPENLGVCRTFNNALASATGEFVSIIATDDLMCEDKLKIQVALLESLSEDVCAVYSDADLIDESGQLLYGNFIQRYKPMMTELPTGNIYQELLMGNFLPAMSVLVRRQAILNVGNFDEDLDYEDYDMWVRLAVKYKFAYSAYKSVKYRLRSKSLTAAITNFDINMLKIFYKQYLVNPMLTEKIFFQFFVNGVARGRREVIDFVLSKREFKYKRKFILIRAMGILLVSSLLRRKILLGILK